MGFMDKVKAQTDALAQKAQQGAKAGQDKLAGMQAKKHADALLEELGGIVYCQRAGRPGTPGEDRVAAIFTQLQSYEAEHGPITPTSADAPVGAPPPGTGFVPGGGEPAQGPGAYAGGAQSGTMPQSEGFVATGVPQSGTIPEAGTMAQPGTVPQSGTIPQSGTFDPSGGIPQSASLGDEQGASS